MKTALGKGLHALSGGKTDGLSMQKDRNKYRVTTLLCNTFVDLFHCHLTKAFLQPFISPCKTLCMHARLRREVVGSPLGANNGQITQPVSSASFPRNESLRRKKKRGEEKEETPFVPVRTLLSNRADDSRLRLRMINAERDTRSTHNHGKYF